MPEVQNPICDLARLRTLETKEVRAYLGDGTYGGYYRRSHEEMRALLTDPWDGEQGNWALRQLGSVEKAEPGLVKRPLQFRNSNFEIELDGRRFTS